MPPDSTGHPPGSAIPACAALTVPSGDAAVCPGPVAGPGTGAERDSAALDFPFPDHGCFGCSATNADGLRLRFFTHGNELRGSYRIAERFHGAPGIAHGGIAATILDEFSCAAAVFLTGQRVMTGELNVRYEKPCPVEQEIEIVARITSREHPRYLTIEAEIRRDGHRLVISTGKFFPQAIAELVP